jgi:transcriptional regulator with XRE-family HTH domain
MQTIDKINLENARFLAKSLASPGAETGIAAFANKLDMSVSQASQLLGANPTKNIGRSMARRIENAFSLPAGWLDREQSAAALLDDSVSDIQDRRRANLRIWVDAHGTPPKEKSYFSQLLAGTASFGERAARRLEKDYNMRPALLDEPAPADITPVDAAPPSQKHLRGLTLVKRLSTALEQDVLTDRQIDLLAQMLDEFSQGTNI